MVSNQHLEERNMRPWSQLAAGTAMLMILGTSVTSAEVWINEIHYDNDGTDTDEGVEIAGTAGTDLSDYKIYAYNGSTSNTSAPEALSGTIGDQAGGYGTAWFDIELQNGAPDGVALVKEIGSTTNVIQFLSYEGSFEAVGGPAAGTTSTDIGVDEQPVPADGLSLQLVGDGSNYIDFEWTGPANHTRGNLNSGQTIDGVAQPMPPTMALNPTGANKSVARGSELTFTVTATEPNGDTIALTGLSLPAGAVFTPNPTNGVSPLSNTFAWTPDTEGNYSVRFTAADVEGTTTQDVDIVVKPAIPPAEKVWINEIHYHNDGDDTNEGVEVAGRAGVALDDYSVVLYRDVGTVYDTDSLTGLTIDDEGDGFGAVWLGYPKNGLQQGPADGLALVEMTDNETNVIQFLSYEGALTATEGPAAGLPSTDIAVEEDGSEAPGLSLQLTGKGHAYNDFSWSDPQAHSRGSLNNGQSVVPRPTLLIIR
jgi:hypothetical protein